MKKNIAGLHGYKNPVVFDFETSGLDPNKHEIIQVAMGAPHTGQEIEYKLEFDMDKADPEALKINGYNEKDWESALSQQKGITTFNMFLNKHKTLKRISKRGNTYWVAALMGYNINAFDMKFLEAWKNKFDKFISADFRTFDVYSLALWLVPELDGYKLEQMAEYFGCHKEGAHDAMVDVNMTADVAACLIDFIGLDTGYEWIEKRLAKIYD